MVRVSAATLLFLIEVFGLYTRSPTGLSLEWDRRELEYLRN